jgi:hypothetical protein
MTAEQTPEPLGYYKITVRKKDGINPQRKRREKYGGGERKGVKRERK